MGYEAHCETTGDAIFKRNLVRGVLGNCKEQTQGV